MSEENKIPLPGEPTEDDKRRQQFEILRPYLLDMDCSEGQPGRYVIYYDDETQRSAKFEANCIKDGFTFKRDE